MKEENMITTVNTFIIDIEISFGANKYRNDNYQKDKIRIVFMDSKYSNDLILNT